MKNIDLKLDFEDILALDKVSDLIKEFSDKNPIKKYTIDYQKIKEKINQLKRLKDEDSDLKHNLFKSILRKLKSIIKREVHPEIFFIIGGHGGVIINDIGFSEFDSPQFAMNCLLQKMELALKTNMPYHIEIAMSCLEWLNKEYPEKISEFLRLFKLGKFEIINPTYSQPYNLIIGAESNIKQFEYGLNVLKQLGLDNNIYYCSECSLHPQIPQILKGFNINFGSLRTRLMGFCPTTNSGNINWIGLDNSKINTITNQYDVFNGEYWHGTFFQEIPNLLFQSISHPFKKYIIYSSIEDLILHLPYQEEIWRVSRFSDIFGKFISCSEFFQEIEKKSIYKFNRDDFGLLSTYLFVASELFLNNKNCETNIISAEIINCVLGLFNENSNDSLFNDLWKKFLLTQAHDNYSTPFIRPGDYSARQLSNKELNKLGLKDEEITISKLSIKLQKEIQNKCKDYFNKGLSKLAKNLGNRSKNTNNNAINFLIFNPTTYLKQDIFSIQLILKNPSEMSLIGDNKNIAFQYQNSTLKFIPEVPEMGFKIYSLIERNAKISEVDVKFFYKINILKDLKTIEINFKDKKICELKFQSKFDYSLSIESYYKDSIEEKFIIIGEINNKTFRIEITQYNGVNRLEFNLNSNSINEIVLIPKVKILKSFINYPFGIEETKRSNIQTLDFLWLKGENEDIIFMQKNSQKFKIDHDSFTIRNFITTKGRFEFAISITNNSNLHSILDYVNSFYYKFLGIKIDENFEFNKKSGLFLSINPSVSLINLWRRKNKSYLRIFNPSNKQNKIQFEGPLIGNQLKEIDFNYNEISSIKNNQLEIDPWKIRTFSF